jgi:23S rRNA pseudouridine2605 synthase
MTDEPTLRLNKHLALQLGVSRREADILIEKGSVQVNGTTATLGARFTDGDTITVNKKPIADDTALSYVIFNKPIGYVCSRRAQGDNPTIYSILPEDFRQLKPVGRLDKDSSGLLLLSNDGDFTFRMTHPKFNKTKVYRVKLDAPLQPLHQQMISDYGVQLEDGTSTFLVSRLEDTKAPTYEITMSEGRNRQIRRTFAALGYAVTYLHRVQFGPYALGDLRKGEYAPTTAIS